MNNRRNRTHIILGAALAASTMLGGVSPALACSTESYVGSICLTAATYCPDGTFETNGQLLIINQNAALFSLVGTTYGGDGKTTFALPDLRSRTPVGVGQGSGLSNILLGQTRGVENITLTTTNMPSHTHQATFSTPSSLKASTTAGQTAVPAANNYLAAVAAPRGTTPQTLYSSDNSSQVALNGLTDGTIAVAPAGGNTPVSVIPPQLGLRYCIVSVGTYPPRPN